MKSQAELCRRRFSLSTYCSCTKWMRNKLLARRRCRMRRTAPEIAPALSCTPIIIIIKCRFRCAAASTRARRLTPSVTRKIAHFQMHANAAASAAAPGASETCTSIFTLSILLQIACGLNFHAAAPEVRKVKMEISRRIFCLQVHQHNRTKYVNVSHLVCK